MRCLQLLLLWSEGDAVWISASTLVDTAEDVSFPILCRDWIGKLPRACVSCRNEA